MQPPIEVDLASLEDSLSRLWKAASEEETETAVIRACSSNLVILAGLPAEAAGLSSLLVRIAEWHPCRTIIAYPGPEPSPDEDPGHAPIRAWISAQCALPSSGGLQICCETLTLEFARGAARQAQSTILSLLVPDLPVFVYWRSLRGSDQPILAGMQPMMNLLIVDSNTARNDPRRRGELLALLASLPSEIPVRDLNWSRLTSWRDLIAQFFDPPAARHLAGEISEVEICRAVERPDSPPTRTLLLTGWLASRLGWQLTSASRDRNQWLSTWLRPGGEVQVRFSGKPVETRRQPGILSVRLKVRTGEEFGVEVDHRSSCLRARSAVEGMRITHTVEAEEPDEASLIVRELSLVGEDQGYRSALEHGIALERAFE